MANHPESQQQVGAGHQRHHQFGHFGDGTDAAEDHHAAQQHQADADVQRLQMEGDGGGLGDGVGLYGVEHQTERDDQEDGEQHAHPAHAETFFHVIGRATAVVAVIVFGFVELSQRAFHKGGGHADKRHHPHPEDGAGAAGGEGNGDAGQVTGADARRQRGTERLKRGDAGAVAFIAVFQHREHVAEVAKLDKAGTQREVDAGAEQQINQH